MTKPSRTDRALQRERALRYLNDIKHIRRNSSAPLAFRLLWRFGVELPPPHFNSFPVNLAVLGGGFGLLWWLIMWPLQWLRDGRLLVSSLLPTLVAALFFGICLASFYRIHARKHGVPPFDQLPESE